MGDPQIIHHLDGIFHYKATIWGYPHFWTPPNVCTILRLDLPSYVKVFASILDVPVGEAQKLADLGRATGGFGAYPLAKCTIPQTS